MGVPTFVVDMSVVRCDMATLVPDAFAGMHYLSMFGSVNYNLSLFLVKDPRRQLGG